MTIGIVVADDHADPFVVAVDLLSQAEHGPDSPAILVTADTLVAAGVDREVRGWEKTSDHAPVWITLGGKKKPQARKSKAKSHG